MTESEEGSEVSQTVPCGLCGRKFLAERLERHTTVCMKIKDSQKRRKKFDSSKQRAELDDGNGFPLLLTNTANSHAKSGAAKPAVSSNKKTSNWREKHEEFLRTVRAARGEKVDDSGESGAAEAVRSRVPVGYIECDCCGRYFSDKAADRHIAWCREQKARIPRSANNNVAMERMKARIKYKPIKSKAKSTTPTSTPKSTSTSTTTTTTDSSRTTTSSVLNSRPSPPTNLKLKNGNIKMMKPPQKSRVSPNRYTPSKKKSPTAVKSDHNRIVSLSRPKRQSPVNSIPPKESPKDPIKKFKDCFPNHQSRDESQYIQKEQLKDILKRTEAYSGGPRTVPGVRTGGMASPVTSDTPGFAFNRHTSNETETDDLAKLKARIEEMYINGSTKFRPHPNNGVVNQPLSTATNGVKKSANSDETTSTSTTTRGSSSGSNESSNPENSRNGSSDGARSQGSNFGGNNGGNGLPKFCHQCGTKYAITIAKYCYECGARRLGTTGPFLTN